MTSKNDKPSKGTEAQSIHQFLQESKTGDSSKGQKPSKSKKGSRSSNLPQTFFALTLMILAVYFILNYLNTSKKLKLKKSQISQIEQLQPNIRISEIQEKIFEKLDDQPDVVNLLISLDGITFKPQIKNEKIIDKLKEEFKSGFIQTSGGAYEMEVDVFNDEDSSTKPVDKSAATVYDDTQTNILLQISFFDKKSKNKIGEVGVTIPMKMLVVKSE